MDCTEHQRIPPEANENHNLPAVQPEESQAYAQKFRKVGGLLSMLGLVFSAVVLYAELDPKLHVLGGGLLFLD